MKRVDLTKRGDKWVARTRSGQTVASARTKKVAVKRTASAAKRDRQAVTVKIHKGDGKFQEERTYPRKADPPRSKG